MSDSRVFKGATRPPMVFGVPLVPMVVISLLTLVPLGWSVVFHVYVLALILVCLFLGVFIWMRLLTKQDNWRTKQEILRMKARKKKGNIKTWGGVSYGPMRLKKFGS